jgi:hypothetical protein
MDSISLRPDWGRDANSDPDRETTIPFHPARRHEQLHPSPSNPPHVNLPHIFAVSAGLMGVSLSGIGLFAILSHLRSAASFGEELLAFNAILFGGSCVTAYLGMRNNVVSWKRLFHLVAEGLLLFGLILMACVCIFLAYSIR